MGIEVKRTEHGFVYKADTPEEAVALARMLAAEADAEPLSYHDPRAAQPPPASPHSPQTQRPPQPRDSVLREVVVERVQLGTTATPSGDWRQPPALDVFWGRLDSRGRTVIRLLGERSYVSLEGMREALGLASTKDVSPVLAAIKRVAKSTGFADYRRILDYRISGARGSRMTIYYAGPLLQADVRRMRMVEEDLTEEKEEPTKT
jgi:hypothetical protein